MLANKYFWAALSAVLIFVLGFVIGREHQPATADLTVDVHPDTGTYHPLTIKIIDSSSARRAEAESLRAERYKKLAAVLEGKSDSVKQSIYDSLYNLPVNDYMLDSSIAMKVPITIGTKEDTVPVVVGTKTVFLGDPYFRYSYLRNTISPSRLTFPASTVIQQVPVESKHLWGEFGAGAGTLVGSIEATLGYDKYGVGVQPIWADKNIYMLFKFTTKFNIL
jgi:hypothetical protein